MSKKFNNKTLLIVFIALAGILLLSELFHKTEKNLKTDIVAFNIDEVNKIEIKTKSTDKPITVLKNGENDWQVSNGEKTFKASSEIVKSYIKELLNIKSQRLAAKSKNKWDEFQLTDSAAIHLKVYNSKNKALLHILVGKLSYKQASNPYGRKNVQGISYVRLANEKEIYAVDGFLPMSLNRGFDDWRDKTLSKFNKDDIKKVNFTYPDSSYTIELKDSVWYIKDRIVDTKKVESFLSGLQNKNGYQFKNDFQAISNPIYELKIEGNNLTQIDVKCYKSEDGKYIIHSDQNEEAFFESDENGLVEQLFKSAQYFIEIND